MAGLEQSEDLAMEIVFSLLEPKSVAAIACVNRRLRSFAGDDARWRAFCSRDLDLSFPIDPCGERCSSFKLAYAKWRESFAGYPWALVVRVKRSWSSLKQWMADNFIEVHNTLQKGASDAEIEDAEKKLGVKLPLPTRILFRFFNGQNTLCTDIKNLGQNSLLGAIGGYCLFEHSVNVHLLSLASIVNETRRYRRQLGYSTRSKRIVVAVSALDEKYFSLNCANGQLLVETENREVLPCVPQSLIRLSPGDGGEVLQDKMLLWLEEHARRLHVGVIGLREFYPRKMICLFPEIPPSCSAAFVNGVIVRASAVFTPERCDLDNEGDEKYWFAYSIRLSLLSKGCIVNRIQYSSCQICSRRWAISSLDNVVEKLEQEAGNSESPQLFPGYGQFVYESFASLHRTPGSIEGSFSFVPGSLTSPQGPAFDVEIARFPLEIPSYIF